MFIKGVVLGFLSSIPLGPIGVICVQRTLGKGRLSGFMSGLGAATADTFLAVVAGLGMQKILESISSYGNAFRIIGGLLVMAIGARFFFKSPVKQIRERKMGKSSLHTDYLTVLILTLSNPLVVFLFLTVFATLNLVNSSSSSFFHYIIFLGIFIGASSWWFTLTTFVNTYRSKFRLKNLWWLNKITGALIFIFGMLALASVNFNTLLP
jgi:threonine/homoserine/homoserine lactone efflux protein